MRVEVTLFYKAICVFELCICKLLLLLLSRLRELTYRGCAHFSTIRMAGYRMWLGYLYKCFRNIIRSKIYISGIRAGKYLLSIAW